MSQTLKILSTEQCSLRSLPDFVQPVVEPVVYGAMTQAGFSLAWRGAGTAFCV